MTRRQVDLGDTEQLRTTFTEDGTPTDPASVSLLLRSPVGVVTTYDFPDDGVSKESTGIFFRDHTFDAQGVWRGRFIGVFTAGPTVDPFEVEVRRTDVV